MAKEKEEKSFEESLVRLETIVKDLQNRLYQGLKMPGSITNIGGEYGMRIEKRLYTAAEVIVIIKDKWKEKPEIVKDLENGSVPLDDAINKFTEAMNISKECNEKLKSAEENVNRILKENGKLEDFQIEE